MTVDTPDTEYAARQWAKVHPLLTALGGRAFFSMPDGSPTFPLVTVGLISGESDEEIPVDHPRLTWDIWDTTKKGASDVRRALVTAMRRCRGVQLTSEVFCYSVDHIESVWAPDNEARLARYVVDATFHVRMS